MRPTIERVTDLNDLIDSVPEEIVRKIQEESAKEEQVLAQPESSNESTSMSNDKKPNKSKLIRDHIIANPGDAPKDIVAALSQHGVTQSDVGNVRTKMKGSKPTKKASPKKKSASAPKASSAPTPVAAPAPIGINLKALEYGTMFLKEAGSLSSARELLIVIDRIRSV